MKIEAYLLSVGNEVLSGRVINTNASFLALELEKIGINVKKVITVADDKEQIEASLNDFILSDAKIIITTGGLGPTHDDFTKEVICEYLKVSLEYSKIAENDMINYFGEIKRNSNYKQLMQPEGAIIVKNHIGTADGFILEKASKIYISLVGPAYEMQPMFLESVKPYLAKYGSVDLIKEYTVMGKSESALEDDLKELVVYANSIGVNIAPYCGNAKIRYQITASETAKKEFEEVKTKFEAIADEYIVSSNNETVEEVIVKLLEEKKETISFSESITGGMLAYYITCIPGASKVLKESLVTYSDASKIKYLGVNEDTISKYDVVSKEVAKEMVIGLKKLTNSDVNIGVTGYAGPDGLDVGKVCYAISYHDDIYMYEKHFKGNRNMIRERACRSIFYDVYRLLKNKR